MPSPPKEFINRALLRQLAGEQLFASGEQCFALGRVRQVKAAKERVSARVTGSLIYQVKLWRRQGELCFRCDCEAGQADTFCKHCVAVGLAWLSRSEHTETVKSADRAAGKSSSKEEDARREQERRQMALHLDTLDKKRLVALLLEATDYDEILRRRLLLETIGISRDRTARGRSGLPQAGPDFGVYQQLLREAVHPNGFVDYHALPDFAQGIEEAIAPMQDLLRAGWHEEVAALAEFVLVELDAVGDRVDTGDGLLNKVYDDLQSYHLEACRSGAPNVQELAARLLHYELEGGLGIFNNAANTYADLLGPKGLAAWRTLLVREWQQTVGSGGPASRESSEPSRLMDHRRFQVQMLTERLARDAGDMDTLLAVKQAELRGVHDHIALAELLAAAGQHEKSIQRAEFAAQKFTATAEKSVCRGFLIAAYWRAGRQDAAQRLTWEEFCDSGGELEHFRELKSLVLASDATHWPEWRDKALEQSRQRGKDGPPSDHSRTVELLIEEKLYDGAWQEAVQGGCRDDLWLLLADRREPDHPQDALHVYEQQIASWLATAHRTDYRETLALIARVRSLYRRLRRETDYECYLAAIRSAHRQKRGFLRLLNGAGT